MMSIALSGQFFRDSSHLSSFRRSTECLVRCMSGVPNPGQKPNPEKLEPEAASPGRKRVIPDRYRFKYPELLPSPKMEWRNLIREKLERKDMLARRNLIDIPEFYIGSVLAVYRNDKHAAEKKNKFVGVCVDRGDQGLRYWFQLRNVVDHFGIEVRYYAYDPTIEKIEVLRLEKRLDKQLNYLKDAPPQYSTFPLDMEPEFIGEDKDVPVNPVKIPLKIRPWSRRWMKWELKGIQEVPPWFYKVIPHEKPWDRMDLMRQYRSTIPEEEQQEIYSEVYSELHQQDQTRKKFTRKDPKKKKT